MGVAGLYFGTSIFFSIMDRRGLRDPICVRRMQWLLHIRSARKPPIGGPMGGKLRLSTGTAGRQRYLCIRPVQSRRRRQFGCPRTIEWRGQAQRFFLDGGTDAHGLRQHRQIACSLRCDTLEDVVEETLYVLDMDAAFDVVGKVRKAAYGSERPQCASTIVAVPRLAQRSQLIEIARKAVIGARTH